MLPLTLITELLSSGNSGDALTITCTSHNPVKTSAAAGRRLTMKGLESYALKSMLAYESFANDWSKPWLSIKAMGHDYYLNIHSTEIYLAVFMRT